MSRPAARSPRPLRHALVAGGVLAGLAVPSAAHAADPLSVGVLLSENRLSTFATSSTTATTPPVPVVGLTAGDSLVGIDVRPQNGQLYGLARNAEKGTVQLYALSSRTGQATALGAPVVVAGTTFGFDFNPKVDRIRVVSDAGRNLRIDPNTGAVAGTDEDVKGAVSKVDGAAYTNNSPNATATTLYTLSGAEGEVALQAPPNSGTQTAEHGLTFLGLPLPIEAVGGFDVVPGVDVAKDDEAAPAGSTGLATVNALGQTQLARIDLNTGAVSPVGPVGDGRPIQGMAIQQEAAAGGLAAVSVTAATSTTSTLRRFDITSPGEGTQVTLTGLTAGEVPAGVAWRPQNGQLLVLGVDAENDRGSLYRVDPQSGAATVIGAAGSVAFTKGGGAAVDLPPVATGYDIDVNPTVDRVRVVAGNGLNLRLNPTVADGASVAVDGNDGGSAAVAGTNPDGDQNGGATDVTGTAYTNGFGQPLATSPLGPTTQLGISAAQDQLLVQNPPNAGTQTAAQTIKVGADRLDVTAVRGFAIPPTVGVTSSGGVTPENGFAVLSTAGRPAGLYAIDISTAAAVLRGTLPAAPTSFAVGDGPEAPGPIPTQTVSPLAPQPPNAPVAKPVVTKAGFGSSTRLTVKLRATRIRSTGPAKVTFRNTNRFAVKVRLQATTPKSGKRGAIRYATKTYTVKASSSRTVNLRLPAAARKELRTKRRLAIRATLRVTAPDGRNRTVRKTLTARRK
jgi:hypothetical protein